MLFLAFVMLNDHGISGHVFLISGHVFLISGHVGPPRITVIPRPNDVNYIYKPITNRATDAKTAWTRDQSLLRSRTDRDHLNTFSVTEIDRTDGLRNTNFTGQRQTTTKAGLPDNLRVQQIPMGSK